MRLKRPIYASTLLATILVIAGLSGTAIAQPTDQSATAPKTPLLRVTPFIAMGDDFAAGAGGAFTFGWTRTLSIEAEASLGRDAARSSLSLLYTLPRLGGVVPYLASGAGVQRDETDTFVVMNQDTMAFMKMKETELAVNIGAGVQIPVSKRWGYRADFRWYNPKAEWPESWRAYSGVTLGWWAPRSEP